MQTSKSENGSSIPVWWRCSSRFSLGAMLGFVLMTAIMFFAIQYPSRLLDRIEKATRDYNNIVAYDELTMSTRGRSQILSDSEIQRLVQQCNEQLGEINSLLPDPLRLPVRETYYDVPHDFSVVQTSTIVDVLKLCRRFTIRYDDAGCHEVDCLIFFDRVVILDRRYDDQGIPW